MDQQPVTPPPQETDSQPQPIAYDAQGHPLYAAPPPSSMIPNSLTTPQAVHVSRAVEPMEPIISNEVKANHEKATKDYPFLSLSEGEYIVSNIRRHPIGAILPLAISLFFVVIIATLVFSYPLVVSSLGLVNPPGFAAIAVLGLLGILLAVIGGYSSVWIYKCNKFFLTNESVIQEIQIGLFTHNEQTVSLMNIEDASYSQKGIMQMMFDYGTIRLSTEGDESTYQFNYAADPKKQTAILNNAVEAFKNGRPVS
jgi:uncharacterized membrane protein YdbT with pleckstrin-like domain